MIYFVTGSTGFIGKRLAKKLLQRIRQLLPPWMLRVGLEGGRINIVPVDFVVDVLDFISHQARPSGKCYHLVDPVGYRIGDVLDILSKAAHGPRMSVFVNAALLSFIPRAIKKRLMALSLVRRVHRAIMADLGLPEELLTTTAPCSSIILVACASPWACCRAWRPGTRAMGSTSARLAC